MQVGQTRGLVELGKVPKHFGQYSGGAAFSCTIVLSERHFGQAGSGSGGFKAGSLPRYLIQRFRALFRLCAIGRRALEYVVKCVIMSMSDEHIFCNNITRGIV